jgi:hypothetical protein
MVDVFPDQMIAKDIDSMRMANSSGDNQLQVFLFSKSRRDKKCSSPAF